MNILKKIKQFLNFMSLKYVVHAEYNGSVMTVLYSNGDKELYEGNCTVWYKLPNMNRCKTSTEMWLSDLYQYNKRWGVPYRNVNIKCKKN